MGIFSKLTGEASGIEKELQDLYLPMLQMMTGMSPSAAKSGFRDMLKQAKEESLKEGTSNLPQNYGDVLLEKESSDEKIKSVLARKRVEGVRDADIKWWWNMHDLERRMMLKISEWMMFSSFIKLKEEDHLGKEEAAKNVRKYHPIYGDPNDTSQVKISDDRPLPHELTDRINIYLEKRKKTDARQFKKEIESSSTLNALIRKEIQKGNI
jgi:hypothetical protein